MDKYQVKDITKEGQPQMLEFFENVPVKGIDGNPLTLEDGTIIYQPMSIGCATKEITENKISDEQLKLTYFK